MPDPEQDGSSKIYSTLEYVSSKGSTSKNDPCIASMSKVSRKFYSFSFFKKKIKIKIKIKVLLHPAF